MTSPDHLTYERRWDLSAATPGQALLAVDGSGNEAVLRKTGAWAASQIRVALDLQPHDRVLELGCGVGRIGRELAHECGEWHGADISSNMLAVAEERLADFSNVFLHKLHRTELSAFEDASIDKAYCAAVFIHLDKEDVFLYLRELARILKPGGRVYFETWNLNHHGGWKWWMMQVEAWAASDQRERKDVSRNQFSVVEEIRLYTERAGLTEVMTFEDSPYLQTVAAKSPTDEQLRAMRAQLRAERDAVVYSQRWSRLFSRVLDIISGRETRDQLLAELEKRDDPEAHLFRAYVQAMPDPRARD